MTWATRLSGRARIDFDEIIDWTVEQFGEGQARAYALTLASAIKELEAGPSLAGVKRRDEIGKGLLSLHIARHGRKGRHLILLRVADNEAQILEVVRILHDAMDFARHVPKP